MQQVQPNQSQQVPLHRTMTESKHGVILATANYQAAPSDVSRAAFDQATQKLNQIAQAAFNAGCLKTAPGTVHRVLLNEEAIAFVETANDHQYIPINFQDTAYLESMNAPYNPVGPAPLHKNYNWPLRLQDGNYLVVEGNPKPEDFDRSRLSSRDFLQTVAEEVIKEKAKFRRRNGELSKTTKLHIARLQCEALLLGYDNSDPLINQALGIAPPQQPIVQLPTPPATTNPSTTTPVAGSPSKHGTPFKITALVAIALAVTGVVLLGGYFVGGKLLRSK